MRSLGPQYGLSRPGGDGGGRCGTLGQSCWAKAHPARAVASETDVGRWQDGPFEISTTVGSDEVPQILVTGALAGTGRQDGLRIRWGKTRESSSLSAPTIHAAAVVSIIVITADCASRRAIRYGTCGRGRASIVPARALCPARRAGSSPRRRASWPTTPRRGFIRRPTAAPASFDRWLRYNRGMDDATARRRDGR